MWQCHSPCGWTVFTVAGLFYLFIYLIYLRIPQQGSSPDRGGLLSSCKRKTHNHTHTRKEERNKKERKDAEERTEQENRAKRRCQRADERGIGMLVSVMYLYLVQWSSIALRNLVDDDIF